MSALRYAISTNVSFAINETVINVSIEQTGIYYELQINLHKVNYITCLAWALVGRPGVLGIWGEWVFIFRELGSTGNYFRGTGEQAHSLRD